MNRTKLLVLLSILLIGLYSNAADTAQLAPVAVLVTDMKGKPSKGEQVFFTGEQTQKVFSGRSDASGKFFIQLPAGDKYFITIKSITDVSKYGVIEIPKLGADEEYAEPFTVNVKFELARSYRLDKVYFDFGKATLRAESFAELGELVDFMKNRETVRIEIAGHTDNVGKDADNLKLSQQRAEAIRNYLLKKGIQPARVVAKGYGATLPIADNATDEGRQKNRRTEVKIL
ncbi:MAG TPA: OmpA family protein [Chitinophagaceae bacterium]